MRMPDDFRRGTASGGSAGREDGGVETAEPPSARHARLAAQMGSIQKALETSGKIDIVLLLVAVACMATARAL